MVSAMPLLRHHTGFNHRSNRQTPNIDEGVTFPIANEKKEHRTKRKHPFPDSKFQILP
jgi:hypothetical protein